MKKKEEQSGHDVKEEQLPAVIDADELEKSEISGFENVTVADVAIPFYGILQSLSPQVKRGAQKIEGAEEGDIFNSVLSQIIKGTEGIFAIPCYFRKAWVEWIPRENGGGFVKEYQNDKILLTTVGDSKGNNVLPNGNNIVETAYHYIICPKEDGFFERAVIACTSTQLKKSRRWIALMQNQQIKTSTGKIIVPPSFAFKYLLKTELEEKDNFSWFGWSVISSELVSQELYEVAKRFAKDIHESKIKITPPTLDNNEVVLSIGEKSTHEVY